jgi:hypothetical protein
MSVDQITRASIHRILDARRPVETRLLDPSLPAAARAEAERKLAAMAAGIDRINQARAREGLPPYRPRSATRAAG